MGKSMYNYDTEKDKIFTDEGQREFIKVRDRARNLLDESGAFKLFSALKDITGDTWQMMAYVDRLVEIGEIKEITGNEVAGQDRVFISAK